MTKLHIITAREQTPETLKARIISPSTKRPILEDLFGKKTFDILKKMLDGDKRLTDQMKIIVIFRVLKRVGELDNGTKTLGDLAADEAKKILNEN